MKIVYYKLSALVLAAISIFPSCTKKIDEAYKNPNAGVRQPIESLLPNVIQNFAVSNTAQGTLYGTQNDGQYIGRYVQFWAANTANNQYDQMSGATGVNDFLGSVWAMHYYGMGANLNRIMEWGEEEKKWDYVGVAHAIRAWSWLTLTDMYGDAIVLKQAFNPDILVFPYDSQQEVYEQVKKEVRLAIEYLNRTGDGVNPANLASGAQYFSLKGDVEKWKKFAYSVMARVFHRTTNKSTYQADSVLHYANLAINSNADNAYVLFEGTTSIKMSYYGPTRGNIGTFRQTRFVADLLQGVNGAFSGVEDPRAIYLIRENTNGTFKGVRPVRGFPDGLAAADQPTNFWGGTGTATTGTNANARYVFKDAMPWPVLTAAEIQFLKAEAYYRKGMKSEALTAYTNGISLNFDMLTTDYNTSVPAARQITPAIKTGYLANTTAVPTAANLTLSKIMLQKYISLYGYGFIETWVDLRRYHYTDLEANTTRQVYTDFAPPAANDLYQDNRQKLVYRARPRYNSEYLYNQDALRSVGAMIGASQVLDYHTKEMWFSMP